VVEIHPVGAQAILQQWHIIGVKNRGIINDVGELTTVQIEELWTFWVGYEEVTIPIAIVVGGG